jgi:hypothetical protein
MIFGSRYSFGEPLDKRREKKMYDRILIDPAMDHHSIRKLISELPDDHPIAKLLSELI